MPQGLAVAGRPQGGQRWSFYVLWALSHSVGWGLLPLTTWSLHRHDLTVFLTNESMNFGMSDELPSFMVSGLVLGVTQWLLLRHTIDRAAWWVAATVIGWSLIAATSLLGLILGGVLVGASQWVVLRRSVRKAGWWIVASALGWLVGFQAIGAPQNGRFLPGILPWLPLRVTPEPSGTSLSTWALPAVEGMVAGGLIDGLVLGAVLVLLLRRDPRRGTPRPHVARR
jgi:hypothetical protein